MAPSAAAKLAFGTKAHADAHLRKVVISANTNGAVKFLRGPVLATLRRPPFPTRDLVGDEGVFCGAGGGGREKLSGGIGLYIHKNRFRTCISRYISIY